MSKLISILKAIFAYRLFIGASALCLILLTLTVATLFSIPQEGTVYLESEPMFNNLAFSSVEIDASSAIVYDATERKVIFELDAQSTHPLASLTKLYTVYAGSLVFGNESVITTTAGLAPTSFLLNEVPAGSRFSFEEFANLILFTSNNSAADMLGERTANYIARESLFKKVEEKTGLTATFIKNSSGLDINSTDAGAYGTAKDVALLAAALIESFPEAIITTKTATTFADTNGRQYSAVNTNQQVEKYPQLLFSKTGYTDLAGGNLCVVLTMNGRTIVIVVLGSTKEGRFADVDTLITSVTNYFSPL